MTAEPIAKAPIPDHNDLFGQEVYLEQAERKRDAQMGLSANRVPERADVVHLECAIGSSGGHDKRPVAGSVAPHTTRLPPAAEPDTRVPPAERAHRRLERDAPKRQLRRRRQTRFHLDRVDFDGQSNRDRLASRGQPERGGIGRVEGAEGRGPPDLTDDGRALTALDVENEEQFPAALQRQEDEGRREGTAPDEDCREPQAALQSHETIISDGNGDRAGGRSGQRADIAAEPREASTTEVRLSARSRRASVACIA